MSTKHTPGPWRATKCFLNQVNPATIVSESGVAVASVEYGIKATGDAFEGREGEFDANARLMAAAPDLLESLQQTVASLEHWFVRHGDPEGVNSLMMKKARAAIAKATGD